MRNPLFHTPIVEVRNIRETVKKKSDVPDSRDAQATLEYWDAYRKKERTRIAGLNLKLDGAGVPLPGQGVSVHFKMDEPPTAENLSRKALEEARNKPLETSPRERSLLQRFFGLFRKKADKC